MLEWWEYFETCVMEIDGAQYIWLRFLIIAGHDFYGCGNANKVLETFQ